MKNVKLFLPLLLISLTLTGTIAYGQDNKAKDVKSAQRTEINKGASDVVAPEGVLDAAAEAAKLEKEGWKSERYPVADQLNSTWSKICDVTARSKSRYDWVKIMISAQTLKDARDNAFKEAANQLSQQVSNEIINNSMSVMETYGAGQLQFRQIERIIRQVVTQVIQNQMIKTFEVYRERGSLVDIQTYVLVDMDKMLKILTAELTKQMSASSDPETSKKIVAEAIRKIQR